MPGDIFSDDFDLGQTIEIPRFGVGQKIFRRHTLQRILGRGGMGVVWLARDEQLDRFVALKVLPETLSYDTFSLEALKRETRLGLNLAHPNVVRIFDFHQDERAAAISMEYVDGPNLSDLRLTKPNHIFSTDELLSYVEALCDALYYAHAREKIVHRDLKPRNLMLNSRGELKVTDFGISKSISESMTMLTGKLGSSGSPPYISPQQWDGDLPTPQDDIYSVGATLYELLTGKPPLIGIVDWQQVHHKIPPPMSQRRLALGIRDAEAIPTRWEEAVAACLAKNPKDRPQTTRELYLRLANGAAKETFVARSTTTPPPIDVPIAKTGSSISEDVSAEETLEDFAGDTIVSRTAFRRPDSEGPPTEPETNAAVSDPPPTENKLVETVEERAQEQKIADEAKRIADQQAADEAKRLAAQRAADEAKRIADQKAAEEAMTLAAQRAADEAKRIADQKAAEEAMRLAAQRAADEAKRIADQKAAEEAMRLAAQRAADEAKRIADQKAAEEAKRLAAQRAADEAKRIADQKAAEEAMRLAAQKAADEAKRIADQQAADEAKRLAAQRAADEAKRIADQKAAEEAKRLAAQKAADEAKRIADQKAAEEAKRLAAQKAADEAKRIAKQKAEDEAKPSTTPTNTAGPVADPLPTSAETQDKSTSSGQVINTAPWNVEALEAVSEEIGSPSGVAVEPSTVPRKRRTLRPLHIGIAALLAVSLTYGVIQILRSPSMTEERTTKDSPAKEGEKPVLQKDIVPAAPVTRTDAEANKINADRLAAERAQEQKAAEEQKRLADQKAAEEQKRLASQKAAEDQKRFADQKAAEEQKRLDGQKAAEDQKRFADQKAAEEQKRLDGQKAAEEAKLFPQPPKADQSDQNKQVTASDTKPPERSKKHVAQKPAKKDSQPSHSSEDNGTSQSAKRPAPVAPVTRPPSAPRPTDNSQRPRSEPGAPGG